MGAGKGDRVRVSFRVRSSTLGLGRSICELGSLAPLAAVSFLYFSQNTHAHTHTRRVTHLFTHTHSHALRCVGNALLAIIVVVVAVSFLC